ncbi:acetyl/propionyl/methylcrotonyl-CoA carboxylase subunit alpha [Pseudoalteromonas luteoviolacea]|uniref:Biotin carboxylase n=1 Tax=Pseudoalteromonas luteoviolacea H33 TaxID=1365251 RepID=A0A167E0G9_9GAMM|nr:acetyl/propionyl/methylcrotonyl-CoA carboxylase subunit alpha [Pseudoalteromonas luteoviolacea]KZN49835.1 3-methylcrotonyl-CoA carboxylase subunit alpha [Pseudoalteromonas luteoviolacea H33]KZN77860.1 3-methylcrotonyl-CoA carboxylase subunit alpha [Pseudoalteromonas luteoviolacea H33-S]MBQ4879436.1 acetyl/propionyl/methylcrotonyl-CoA carboxylase subunit alpha [Pseudoalteromonas luteoviolacea]MBQ4908496.1 acetyl/propionyl/methylcrotonyl-CoA carboxylase subunit alpha [Pseudoalteromonas luteovi
MLKKILIANRGEIACRVMRTAKRLGMSTVAVYSEADADALHVKQADEAYFIGPAPSKDSYLVSERILEVAKQSGADCIHPGYGFLSENDAFANACEENNIVFIGPLASSIEAMGSKTRAKEIMAQANVPLVPGYYGQQQDTEFLTSEAEKVGYPVLIKAAFGGGGKGMRVVRSADEFLSALEGAKREALASFGNDLVLLERFVDKPRHVEVQVFADNHGNCVYLGDRDCSLQRRHQKVIEEAPAPDLSDALRKEMGEAAVRCAQAINYRGAGTVEFLLCGDEFFFMEMNTRLQVEHPVTEMVTGQDLVEWQIRVANNEHLPLSQAHITLQGHSFEARIYAEDPEENFMPYSGNLAHLSFPKAQRGVRIDTGVQQGDEISPFYDPMIAKLIVHGHDRRTALLKLRSALNEVHLAGVKSNIAFLHHLAEHPTFMAGAPDTHFIDTQTDELTASKAPSDTLVCLASIAYLAHKQAPKLSTPWQQVGFRLNQARKLTVPFTEHFVVAQAQGHHWQVHYQDFEHRVEAKLEGHQLIANVDGKRMIADVLIDESTITVMYGPYQHTFELKTKHYVSEQEHQEAPLAAPLNGTVVKHLQTVGATVSKGDPIVVIEAMKMEYTLNAPFDGTLTSYCFDEGELVSHGAMLAIVEEQANG